MSPLVSCTDQLDSESPAGHVLRLQRLLRHDPDVAAANHVQPLGILEYGEPGLLNRSIPGRCQHFRLVSLFLMETHLQLLNWKLASSQNLQQVICSLFAITVPNLNCTGQYFFPSLSARN